MSPILRVQNLSAGFGERLALREISLQVLPGSITALIGPSGCGKTTFLRCMNRMHEEEPGGYWTGKIELQGLSQELRSLSLAEVRRRVGMVFREPRLFSHYSVFENLSMGSRAQGRDHTLRAYEDIEFALKKVRLWNEFKDRLHSSVDRLSSGEAQLLSLARTLSLRPQVLLLDEPGALLDPIFSSKLEEVMEELKQEMPILMVTHSLQQAGRIADRTAFFLDGRLVEEGETQQIFVQPREALTEAYITGRMG